MKETIDSVDVLVIGGGPAGASLATFLAREGREVLVLEQARFPRFHVGESLLPMTQEIWEELGICEELAELGQTVKTGGEWRLGHASVGESYDFTRVRFDVLPRKEKHAKTFSYQVERALFDELVLDNAARQGARVEQEATVLETLWEGDRAVGVRWLDRKTGRTRQTRAAFVADCSGRQSRLARELDVRVPDARVKTAAIFGHFDGVTRAEGLEGGKIHVYMLEHGWLWLIPLAGDVMSVGLVMNAAGRTDWGDRSPEEILHGTINRHAFLRARFGEACSSSKVRRLHDLPYRGSRVAGPGWLLAGDAGFFVDPLFSSGVHVAFTSAKKAAAAIGASLDDPRSEERALAAYDRWSQRYQSRIFGTVRRLYALMGDQLSMKLFLMVTGKYGRHWDTTYLRRLNAWGLGRFDDYFAWVLGGWIFCDGLVGVGKLWRLLSRRPSWPGHVRPCEEPELDLSPRVSERTAADGAA